MTTRETIRNWLSEGENRKDLTHMIVVCDTFDWEDYPIFVSNTQRVREVYDKYDEKNMQRVMEVYSFARNIEDQLNEHRAFHLD